MRRWLFVVLLAVVPFQFSWAALAAYGQHEAAGIAVHMEHHHAHLVHDAASDDASAADLDCGHCHGHYNAIMTLQSPMSADAQPDHPAAASAPSPQRILPARPERPQWAGLA